MKVGIALLGAQEIRPWKSWRVVVIGTYHKYRGDGLDARRAERMQAMERWGARRTRRAQTYLSVSAPCRHENALAGVAVRGALARPVLLLIFSQIPSGSRAQQTSTALRSFLPGIFGTM